MLKSWESLSVVYGHALKVLEYKSTLDIDDILFYQDISDNPRENVLYYPQETELRIGNAIKAGDGEQACTVIKELIDKNLSHHLTPETVRYLMLNITGTVINTVNQINR